MWCRWNECRLLLAGRSDERVWGRVMRKGVEERFSYRLREQILTIGDGEAARELLFDEQGIVITRPR